MLEFKRRQMSSNLMDACFCSYLNHSSRDARRQFMCQDALIFLLACFLHIDLSLLLFSFTSSYSSLLHRFKLIEAIYLLHLLLLCQSMIDHWLHSPFRVIVLFLFWIYFDHYFVKIMFTSLSQVSCSNSSTVTPSSGSDSLLSPVGSISRPKSLTNSSLCSESTTSSVSSLTSNYPKAPGFEREDQVHRLLSYL